MQSEDSKQRRERRAITVKGGSVKQLEKFILLVLVAGAFVFGSLTLSQTAQAREAGSACGEACSALDSVTQYISQCAETGDAAFCGSDRKRPPKKKKSASKSSKNTKKSAQKKTRTKNKSKGGKKAKAKKPKAKKNVKVRVKGKRGKASKPGQGDTNSNPLESNPEPLEYLLPRVEFDEDPVGICYGPVYRGDEFNSYLQELGVDNVLLQVYWWMIERPNNVYHFELVDAFLDELDPEDEAMIVVYTSSMWGTGTLGKGDPPLDYDEYYEFIHTLVSHCQGRVKYWQRDPEPATPGHWNALQYEEYVATQKEFYRAVKNADPDAIVPGCGYTGYWTKNGQMAPETAAFLDYFFANAQNDFDALDLHLYYNPYTIPVRVNWFREKMQLFGYEKPIITAEFGGPHPQQFDGWEEFQYICECVKRGYWDDDVDFEEHLRYMIDHKDEFLTPEILMFFGDCGEELDGKYNRVHARDIVHRTMLSLASGVKKTYYWNLHSHWPARGPNPLFGKLRLVDLTMDLIDPDFHNFKLQAEKLNGITAVSLVDTGVRENLLFQVERGEFNELYVVWEKRHLFTGEDDPAIPFEWAFPWSVVKVTDIFGNEEILYADGNGIVTLMITDTPFFVEEYVY